MQDRKRLADRRPSRGSESRYPSVGSWLDTSRLLVAAQYLTERRATDTEKRRDLFVAEPALVECPDDRLT